MSLQAGLLEISNCKVKGVCGLPTKPDSWCILGSLQKQHDKLRRDTMLKEMERDEIFENLFPWIIPGNILVQQKFAKWNDDKSIENAGNPRPLFNWSTNQIVLAAGK